MTRRYQKNAECMEKEMRQSLTLFQRLKKLIRKAHTQRHDNILRIVHLELCQKFGLVGEVKWCNHKPASVVENNRVY